MAKIVNIVTGQEETELVLKDEEAIKIMAYLRVYPVNSYGEILILNSMIKMVENNSSIYFEDTVEKVAE